MTRHRLLNITLGFVLVGAIVSAVWAQPKEGDRVEVVFDDTSNSYQAKELPVIRDLPIKARPKPPPLVKPPKKAKKKPPALLKKGTRGRYRRGRR